MAANRLKREAHMTWVQFRAWSEEKKKITPPPHTQSCETSFLVSTNPRGQKHPYKAMSGKACSKCEKNNPNLRERPPLLASSTHHRIPSLSTRRPFSPILTPPVPQKMLSSLHLYSTVPWPAWLTSGHLHHSLLFLDACTSWSHFPVECDFTF